MQTCNLKLKIVSTSKHYNFVLCAIFHWFDKINNKPSNKPVGDKHKDESMNAHNADSGED